jgi:hypothetical protein
MPFPDKSTYTLVLMKTVWQYVTGMRTSGINYASSRTSPCSCLTVDVKYVTGMSYALPYVHFGSQQLAAEALMVAQF